MEMQKRESVEGGGGMSTDVTCDFCGDKTDDWQVVGTEFTLCPYCREVHEEEEEAVDVTALVVATNKRKGAQ